MLILFIRCSRALIAQFSGSFVVQGDIDKYYPVTFLDAGNNDHVPTELNIGRSGVHLDADWRGSLIAQFKYHTTNWGNASHFIEANIQQTASTMGAPIIKMIAGWEDVTWRNGDQKIVIWLRGGSNTYYWRSNYQVSPTPYVATPYQETNGPAHTYKTAIDYYVNSTGLTAPEVLYVKGIGSSYFHGNIGIGTADTKNYRLAVNGSAIFTKAVVKAYGNWPDFVFEDSYQLPPLSTVEKYIRENKHLPEVPSAAEVAKNGLDLGTNQAVLLKKIEELTLYLIKQEKILEEQQDALKVLKGQVKLLEAKRK